MLIATGWIYAQVIVSTMAVLVVGATPFRRGLAALFIMLGCGLALIAPPHPLLRVVLAQLILIAFLKAAQIASAPDTFPPARRVWHYFALFHVDRARTPPPRFPLSLFAVLLGWALLCVLSVVGLLQVRHGAAAGWTGVFLRMFCALALFHGLMDFVCQLHRFFYALAGLDVPHNQRRPILSRTVREFWGVRWNRLVSEWLGRYVFQPFNRRGWPKFGLLATFFASAAIHFWLIVVPLDLKAALSMASYFVLHGAIAIAELRLRPRAWPVAVARAWTLFAVIGPSPLLVEPFLKIIGL
jgi:hypothetical protein